MMIQNLRMAIEPYNVVLLRVLYQYSNYNTVKVIKADQEGLVISK